MPLAEKVSILTRVKAEISGNVNCAPNKPKFVLMGDELTFIRLSPIVSAPLCP